MSSSNFWQNRKLERSCIIRRWLKWASLLLCHHIWWARHEMSHSFATGTFKNEGLFDCVDRVKRLKSLASTIHYDRISHNLNTHSTSFYCLFLTAGNNPAIPTQSLPRQHSHHGSLLHDTPNPSPLHSIFIAATSHTHILTPLPPQYNPIKESFPVASLLLIS